MGPCLLTLNGGTMGTTSLTLVILYPKFDVNILNPITKELIEKYNGLEWKLTHLS